MPPAFVLSQDQTLQKYFSLSSLFAHSLFSLYEYCYPTFNSDVFFSCCSIFKELSKDSLVILSSISSLVNSFLKSFFSFWRFFYFSVKIPIFLLKSITSFQLLYKFLDIFCLKNSAKANKKTHKQSTNLSGYPYHLLSTTNLYTALFNNLS